MFSHAWSKSFCVLCLVVVQTILAEKCLSYLDSNGALHESVECEKYCCGDCDKRDCCANKNARLPEEGQELCPERPFRDARTALIAAGIAGAVLFVLICVTLLICFFAPCCPLYMACRKQPKHTRPAVSQTGNDTQSAQQPPPTGYQLVPGNEGAPLPTAPPSYLESTDPSQNPVGFPQGQPMHPISPLSDEFAPPPYNPSYEPQP